MSTQRSVPFGLYTVVDATGSHKTIKIESAAWATSVPAGSVVVSRLNYSQDYTKFGFITPAGEIRRWKVASDGDIAALQALLTGDYESYGLAYALESSRCWRCNRTLTVPASIHRGLGPDCAQIVDRTENKFTYVLPEQVEGSRPVVAEGTSTTPAPVAPAAAESAEGPNVWLLSEDNVLGVRFGFDSRFNERKDAVKEELRGRWNSANGRWQIVATVENAAAVSQRFAALGLTVEEGLPELFYSLHSQRAVVLEGATAATSDFAPNGLAAGLELMPFQRAGVEQVLKTGRSLIADQMGLGKTVQALAAVAHTEAFPALVICPASLKLNWKREAQRWIPGARVTVLNGTGNLAAAVKGSKAIVVINYENLSKHALADVSWGAVVVDEAHYIKNSKSQRTKAVKAILAKATNARARVLLTGTPVLNRPVELWSLIEALGYAPVFGSFMDFARRYCDAHQTRFGWDFSGATNVLELNERLKANGIMVRRLKEDVLTDLPAKRWAAVPVSMGLDRNIYDAAEADAVAWFAGLPERRARIAQEAGEEWDVAEDNGGLSRDEWIERALNIARTRSEQAEQLVRFEALKTAAWRSKRAGVVEWIENFLEGSDKKLIVFGHHIEVVNDLAKTFRAPKIQGGMTTQAVEEAKARFQNDPECRVIVANLQAGGVGHTLTAASDVAFVEFPWTPALLDQAIDRAHRIGQTDSVTGWLLLADRDGEETIDDEINALLEKKRAVVDAVTDGEEVDSLSGSIQHELAALWSARANPQRLEGWEAQQADRYDRVHFGDGR